MYISSPLHPGGSAGERRMRLQESLFYSSWYIVVPPPPLLHKEAGLVVNVHASFHKFFQKQNELYITYISSPLHHPSFLLPLAPFILLPSPSPLPLMPTLSST